MVGRAGGVVLRGWGGDGAVSPSSSRSGKRAMMESAQSFVLLVNHAKFGKAALHELASL